MAAKGLYINSTEQGFTVRGISNNFFPDNATLAYPANSVILIADESDMATFRSASNYDVLFSALIKDININGERVTRDNIIRTFNEAANKPMGNPDAFTSVEYDGTKSLIFYNDKGDEVANVDVTPFIKDGMIEDVEISDGNLVIHFNTDSDIKDIYIPLTEIFDPETYYTKQEIDNQVNDLWNTIDEKEEVVSTALNALNEDVENLSNDKQDNLQYYSEAETHGEGEKESKIEIEQSNENNSAYAFIDAYTQFTEDDKFSAIDLNTNTQTADGRTNYTDLSLSDSGIQIYYDKAENGVGQSAHIDIGTSGIGSQITIDSINDSQSTNIDIQPTGVTINGERVLTESDGVYYISFATITTTGIRDEDWDGIVAAIDGHRPIYAGYPENDGGILYYGVECMNKNSNNTQISLTSSDDSSHYFYTFTKNGSNDYSYTVETRPYTTAAEKDAWNAKADASNVYTKTESDAKYATQVVVNEEIAARIQAIRDVNTALEGKADKSDTYTKTETDNAIATAMEDIDLSDYVDVTTFNRKELATAKALTQLNDTKADKTELPDVSTLATKTELNAKANTADLATVATSGSYNDLSDKPVIPDTTNLATKSEVEALEPYAVDLDAYVANGITEAQYDEIVQAVSDGRVIKATYGTRDYTVESVYVDGDVMKISLSDELKHRFFQFGRSTGTVSPTTAEYVSLVEKGVWNAKQAALISGTNIKTVNNQSILGEGNIDIQFTETQSDWNVTDTTSSAFIKNKPDLSEKVSGLGGITSIEKIASSEYEHRKYIGTINSNTLYVVKPTEWEVIADDGNGTFEFTTGDAQTAPSQFLSEISSASLQTLSESFRGSDGYEGYTVTFADLVTGETYTATPHTDSGYSVIIFNATIDGETVTLAMQIDTTNYTLNGMTLDSQTQRYLGITFQFNA